MPGSSWLLDDEDLLTEVRPHWTFLWGPAFLTVVAVAVASVVAVTFPNAPVAVAGVLGAMMAVPLVWLAGRLARWRGVRLAVTTRRILYRSGVLRRDVVQVPLTEVLEVHGQRDLGERLLGTGRLVIERGTGWPLVIEDVPRPRSLQRLIEGQLDVLASTAVYRTEPGPEGLDPTVGWPPFPTAPASPASFDRTPPRGTPTTVVAVSPRFRCSACGNLTRFDVTTTSTVRAFHHYSVGGELEIEDQQVVSESIEEVSCRWCGHGRAVEVVEDPTEVQAAGGPATAPGGAAGAVGSAP